MCSFKTYLFTACETSVKQYLIFPVTPETKKSIEVDAKALLI